MSTDPNNPQSPPPDTPSLAFIAEAQARRKAAWPLYHGYEYVPMGEARSLAVPVTVGCSYNRCLFCDLNHNLPFRILSLAEIDQQLENLVFLHRYDRRPVKRATLMQGNALCLPTQDLLAIIDLIRMHFPSVEGIGSFACVRDVLSKGPSDLQILQAAGLDHLTLGIESGSDRVLSFHQKGVTVAEMGRAMRMVNDLALPTSAYLILGLGGQDHEEDHVQETARFLNQYTWKELILLTLVLFKRAPLVAKVRTGEFRRVRPLACMREARDLVQLLTTPTWVNGTHKNNAFPFKGKIPDQKEALLEYLEKRLEELAKVNETFHEAERWTRWSNE